MARAISSTLLIAQQGAKRKPYIRVIINGIDYSGRVLFVEHHEEPYKEWATIRLDNSDRALNALATESSNLLGFSFRIGYGYVTEVANEYSESADIWVKTQTMVSRAGKLYCELFCTGQWTFLSEKSVMALPIAAPTTFFITDPANVGSDPTYSTTFEATKTVYQLIESLIEGAFGWTLNPLPAVDDTIINSFSPVFSISKTPSAREVLMRLISMTRCYLRSKAGLIWEVIYPRIGDSVDEVFYSNELPYFIEYAEKLSLVIPNRIVVFANNPDELAVWPTPVIVGDTGAYTGNYTEILEPILAPTIITQANATARATAVLARYTAEEQSGYLIVSHDCRMEIYDKVLILDRRGL